MVDQLPWTETSAVNEGEYDYARPLETSSDSVEADLIKLLAATDAFKRLGDVRFLGALDYFLVAHPNGNATNKRYTRLQHSLGVAALAKSYLDLRKHSPQERLLCVAAAMLHDIGHPPFSHTLEPVFQELFGLEHHRASERIITGQIPLGLQVSATLQKFGIDPLAVVALLNGGDDLFDGFFSGPINFDTIEGILRTRSYLKMQRLGLSPHKVMQAAAVRDEPLCQQVVDAFWESKHEIYTLVIRSRLGVLYDTLFQSIARGQAEALSVADFFSTESDIFRKIPLLREALKKEKLKSVAQQVMPQRIEYQIRHFFVDATVSFTSQDDKARYRQSKTPASLTLTDILPA
ncbi:MAG: HD domain-containing protein [Allosphingosinicella sp.]